MSRALSFVFVLACMIGFPVAARAGTVVWDLHIHQEIPSDTEFEPDLAAFQIDEFEAVIARPVGPQWDFLGVAAGDDIYVLPKSQDPDLPFIGFGTEEIAAGFFDAYVETDARVDNITPFEWVTLSLKGVSGPGDFSVWDTDTFGEPIVWAASSDGIDASDKLLLTAGSHQHFFLGFSAVGLYEIEFEASAMYNGSLVSSGPVKYTFDFGDMLAGVTYIGAGAHADIGIAASAVPEPTSLAIFSLLGAAGLIASRVRNRKKETFDSEVVK